MIALTNTERCSKLKELSIYLAGVMLIRILAMDFFLMINSFLTVLKHIKFYHYMWILSVFNATKNQ